MSLYCVNAWRSGSTSGRGVYHPRVIRRCFRDPSRASGYYRWLTRHRWRATVERCRTRYGPCRRVRGKLEGRK